MDQRASRSTPSSTDDKLEHLPIRSDSAGHSKPSWRPYETRWPAKPSIPTGPAGNFTSAPRNPDDGTSAPSRKNRKHRNSKQGNKNKNNAHPHAQVQGHNGPTNAPNMNYPAFTGLPGMANAPPFPPPFFAQNMSNPQQSVQYPLPGGDPNSFTPSWNDMSNFMNFLPPLPPPPFMNNIPGQQPQPLLSGFPPFPFDPMAFAAATGSAQPTPPGAPSPLPPFGSPSRDREREPVNSPAPPSPTPNYLSQASQPPRKLPTPRPLLVILDLNGTLIHRKHRRIPPVFARRAGLENFLTTLSSKYKVMIWSSSQPETVKAVCEKLFPGKKRQDLVAEWGRDRFGLTKSQYRAKIQVYKTLHTVWANEAVQSTYPSTRGNRKRQKGNKTGEWTAGPGRQWDQTNTILIDDSKLKAASQPYNILEIPEFTNQPDDDANIFPNVLRCLDILSRHDDVSKVLHEWNSQLPDAATATATADGATGEVTSILNVGSADVTVDQRQLRRKAKKQEKKAVKREKKAAAALEAAKLAAMQGDTSTVMESDQAAVAGGYTSTNVAAIADDDVVDTDEDTGEGVKTTLPQPPQERSPSPVSSVGSENYLLDRLEESLNVHKR